MKQVAFPLAMLVLLSCNEGTGPQGEAAAPDSAGAERVECALAGAANFERRCTVETASSENGTTLIIRAPDGGFRRLLLTADGRGLVAADGAEPARVMPIGSSEIEVAIGRDRYRVPATVKGSGAAEQ